MASDGGAEPGLPGDDGIDGISAELSVDDLAAMGVQSTVDQMSPEIGVAAGCGTRFPNFLGGELGEHMGERGSCPYGCEINHLH